MSRYLITGGAGFIGANFVKYLLRKYGNEANLLILDSLTYAGNLENLSEELTHDNVEFIRGDIRDEQLVGRILADFDPDFVVNFAAETHVDRSITGPQIFLETNILGTQNLLEACRRAWLTGHDDSGKPLYRAGHRFLQISTDEVYGSLTRDFDTPQPLDLSDKVKSVAKNRADIKSFGSGLFTEDTPLAPRSPYSASKTSADLFTIAYGETYGLPVNITRCSNNYGPCQFPEKLIPLVINNILEGKKLPVYGKGENVRDWLYVDDHAKAIDMVLTKGRVGEIYNIGGFNEEQNITIVKTVIDIIRRIMDNEPDYRHLLRHPAENINHDLITYVTDRPGHDMRYAIDPTKIATELGWYPETPFAEGIEKTVRWYLDNPEWVSRITSGDYRIYYEKMYANR